MASETWPSQDTPPYSWPRDKPEDGNPSWPHGIYNIHNISPPVESRISASYEPQLHTENYPQHVSNPSYPSPPPTQYAWESSPSFHTTATHHHASGLLATPEPYPRFPVASDSAYSQGNYNVSDPVLTPLSFLAPNRDGNAESVITSPPALSPPYGWQTSSPGNAPYSSYNVDKISSAMNGLGLSNAPLGGASTYPPNLANTWRSPVTAAQLEQERIRELRQSMSDQNNSLHEAVIGGDLKLCRKLVIQGHYPDECNAQDYTAMHFAAAYDQFEILCLFLAIGADPEVKSKEKITPLHLATFVGSVKCVNELLDYIPQDWEVEDDDGIKPYATALRNGSLELIELFLGVGAKLSEEELERLISEHDILTQTKIRQLATEYDRTAEEKLQLRQYPNDVKVYIKTLFDKNLVEAYNILDGLSDLPADEREDIRDLLLQNFHETIGPCGIDDESDYWSEPGDEFEYQFISETFGAVPLCDQSAQVLSPIGLPLVVNSTHDEKKHLFNKDGALRFLDLRGCTALNENAGDFASDGFEIIVQDFLESRIRDLYIAPDITRLYLPEKAWQTEEESFESSLYQLFSWLTDHKGVESVAEIRVCDPCTPLDESNLTRLLLDNGQPRFMGIKKLCWLQKVDKPFEPVLVAPDVEEIWIEWDGYDLDYRLEHWRSALMPLGNLVKINIVVEHDDEVDDLKQIAQNWLFQCFPGRAVDVDFSDLRPLFHAKNAAKSYPAIHSSKAMPLAKNDAMVPDGWFHSLQVYNKNDPIAPLISRDASSFFMSDTTEPIKVAIVDTGIDCGNEKLSENIIKRKAFPPSMHDFLDLQGHGTHVAGLVLKVAPNAQILCARVFDDNYINKPSYLAEAIDWAVKEGAKVICCSWGASQSNQTLIEACKRAYSANCLVFAAGSNSGHGRPALPYPAFCGDVISIGSCNDTGKKSDITHSMTKFWFPGESIASYHPRYLNTGKDGIPGQKIRTGCSMANALAVGLAARLLDQARRCLSECDAQSFESNVSVAMQELFGRLTAKDADGLSSKYVNAWNILLNQARNKEELVIFFKQTLRHLGCIYEPLIN
ncbi:hypothetical protein ABW19_dt0200610 [Dactylella cylindrospora]|nr:hypothetical protein ABW19_dt0200610 [Dactylella cylindrospora]